MKKLNSKIVGGLIGIVSLAGNVGCLSREEIKTFHRGDETFYVSLEDNGYRLNGVIKDGKEVYRRTNGSENGLDFIYYIFPPLLVVGGLAESIINEFKETPMYSAQNGGAYWDSRFKDVKGEMN